MLQLGGAAYQKWLSAFTFSDLGLCRCSHKSSDRYYMHVHCKWCLFSLISLVLRTGLVVLCGQPLPVQAMGGAGLPLLAP